MTGRAVSSYAVFRSDPAHFKGCMSQHGTAIDVAAGIDIVNRGFHGVVNDNSSALSSKLLPQFSQTLQIGGPAGGKQNHIAGDLRCVCDDGQLAVLFNDLLNALS